jgi:hypothetical protein
MPLDAAFFTKFLSAELGWFDWLLADRLAAPGVPVPPVVALPVRPVIEPVVAPRLGLVVEDEALEPLVVAPEVPAPGGGV